LPLATCHVPHATHSSSVLTEISNICGEVPIVKPLVTKFLFSFLSLPPKPPAMSLPAPYSQTLSIFSPVNIGHRGLHPYTTQQHETLYFREFWYYCW
jgi:hypothetical protein